MNLDLIFAIIFYGLLFIFFLRNRPKFEIQGKIIALYRTKLGLRFMNWLAKKFRRSFVFLGYSGIFFGFVGMLVIFYTLLKGAVNIFLTPEAPPVLAPVFPGISLPGLPTLGFWHWIIAIFFVAVVHEFAHGIITRVHNVKIKSSGFAFMGPILAAFVEPDEKKMEKKSKKAQLSIFAAGPFSNIIFGVLALLLLHFLITPFSSSLFEFSGVQVFDLDKNQPAALSGITSGEMILEINGAKVNNLEEFQESLKDLKPGDNVKVKTDLSSYNIIANQNPTDENKGYLGIRVNAAERKVKEEVQEKYGSWFPGVVMWFRLLVYWIFLVNVGVGLFNLLPWGPLDGGRMFYVMNLIFFKKKRIATKFLSIASWVVGLLIVINLLPWLNKLLMFLAKSFSFLISLF